MGEDAYSREQMWRQRGLVRLIYADATATTRDAEKHDGVDENRWNLVGTMPAPPAA